MGNFRVPICFILSIPFLYIWLNLLSPVETIYFTQYKFGCYAIAFSCIIEMCAEAPVFLGQVFCFVKLKIVLDTMHIMVRSLVFITLVLTNSNIAIYAFGIAQLFSALTIIIGNYSFFHMYINKLKNYRLDVSKRNVDNEQILTKYGPYYENMDDFPFNNIREMIPGGLPNTGNYFNSDLQVLIFSFAKQGILKQVLTEGEKYVMSVSPWLSFSEQATYDIVNNMGSLAARFIFRPIEDSSYFYFTQTIARDVELKQQDRVCFRAHLSIVCSYSKFHYFRTKLMKPVRFYQIYAKLSHPLVCWHLFLVKVMQELCYFCMVDQNSLVVAYQKLYYGGIV